MERRHYQYAGLRVVSAIPLPEWAPFEQPDTDGDPDVVISLGDSAADPGRPAITPREHRFAVPDVGSFRITEGREIAVAPRGGIALDLLRPWLLGTAWGALCYQRGLILIHGSAVVFDGQAVLFCAPAKGGKSTLAAHLNARGYSLVSDDLCHLRVPPDGPPTIYPSAPRLKLWEDALRDLGLSTNDLNPDPSRRGKFHIERLAGVASEIAPVQAIYLLEWGDFRIRRLSGLAALSHFLAASTYRPEMLDRSCQLMSKYSRQSISVLQRVPLWELRRPRHLAKAAEVVDLLTKHLSG